LAQAQAIAQSNPNHIAFYNREFEGQTNIAQIDELTITISGGTINDDPQFVGLQGQSYQVHGYPREVFNLVSSPSLSLNSQFDFLSSGVCNYNNTGCWTHPGTYLGQLGFNVGNDKVKLVSGTHKQGMGVWINDVAFHANAQSHIPLNNSYSSIVLVSPDQVSIQTPHLYFQIFNADNFFNLRVSLLDGDLIRAGSAPLDVGGNSLTGVSHDYPSHPLHGLIGQTWRNVKYADGVPFEGEIEDYMIQSRNLFDTQFVFSQFRN